MAKGIALHASASINRNPELPAAFQVEERKRLNGSSPINKSLPQELLVEIFLLYSLWCFEHSGHESTIRPAEKPTPPSVWIRVSHVCCYWRQVALSFPILWSAIVACNQDYLIACLARSQEAQLTIVVGESRRTSDSWTTFFRARNMLMTIVPHFSRVRSLSIYSASFVTELHSLFHPKFKLPATLDSLRSLRIQYIHREPLRNSQLRSVTKEVLSSSTPILERLHISDRNFGWLDRAYTSTLTYLSVSGGRKTESHTMSTVLEVLSGLPALQHLHLIHALPSNTQSSSVELNDKIRNLSLLHLKILELEDVSDVCACLLQRLSFPSKATLRLTLDLSMNWSLTVASTLGTIASTVSGARRIGRPSPIRGVLIFTTGEPGEVTIAGWTWLPESPLSFLQLAHEPGVRATVRTQDPWQRIEADHFIYGGRLCNVLPLASVEALCFHGYHKQLLHWPGTDWCHRRFEALRDLRFLRLVNWDISSVASLLSSTFADNDTSDVFTVSPRLEVLEIHSSCEEKLVLDKDGLSLMVKGLGKRKDAGLSVGKLEISGFVATASIIQKGLSTILDRGLANDFVWLGSA